MRTRDVANVVKLWSFARDGGVPFHHKIAYASAARSVNRALQMLTIAGTPGMGHSIERARSNHRRLDPAIPYHHRFAYRFQHSDLAQSDGTVAVVSHLHRLRILEALEWQTVPSVRPFQSRKSWLCCQRCCV